MINRKSPGARPRGAIFLVVARSVGQTLVALTRERLGSLIPLVLVLFLIAFVLMLFSTSNPLAPFIYPLL
jgi:hypothetical protein